MSRRERTRHESGPMSFGIRGRNHCPSASAQRAAAQILEASSAHQHRPAIACRALSPGLPVATGDMIIVRYADDFIVGFQHESDARRFLNEMRERVGKFALSLHPEKTRIIEFGRFAA